MKHAETTFSTWTWKTSPPSFQDEILIMEIWKGLANSSFYQKHQEYISGITPIIGKEDLLSFWPRAQRNGTPQLKPQEAYKILLIFSLHRNSSLPTRLAARSFHILLQNEGATSSMQDRLAVNSVSLNNSRKPPENQFLQNVHLPRCRYIYLVNCTPSLRTIDYSPFCYRRYLGMSVK